MSYKQALADFNGLMKFMKPRIGLYYAGMLGDALTTSSLTLLLSFVIKYLLNYAVTGDASELNRAIYLVCGSILALSLISPFCNYLYLRCIKITMGDIRMQAFAHIGRLSFRFAEEHHSGDLLSRITNDVQTIEKTYAEHLKSITSQVIVFAGSVVLLLILDWRFALVLIALGLMSMLLNSRFAGPMRDVSDLLQKQMGELTERLSDLIAGLPVVKLFGLRNKAGKLCDDASEEVSKSGLKQGHQSGVLEAGNFLIQFLSLGGILLIGLYLVSRGELKLGDLGQIVQLQSGISAMFLQLGSAIALMQNSFAGVTRLREILDGPVEPEAFPGAAMLPAGTSAEALPAAKAKETSTDTARKPIIEMEGVTFGYDADRAVLSGLSLALAEGEVTALVGPSGGGKSTVMKLLLGFYPPDAGTLTIHGRPAGEFTLKEIRDMMAYVPQEATLFHGTVADNIRFGCEGATQEEVEAAAKAAYADAFIRELPDGYETLVGERGAGLSGGQRQRIAIARALLKNAPVLLLDEATSALDAESEHEVQQALQVLMQGRTTLVIAHRLATIEGADSICVIGGGRLQEQGTHDQLLAKGGMYAELYHLQFRPEEALVS